MNPPHISSIFDLSFGSGFLAYCPTAFARTGGRFLRSSPIDAAPDLTSSSVLSRRNRSTEFRMWTKPRLSL